MYAREHLAEDKAVAGGRLLLIFVTSCFKVKDEGILRKAFTLYFKFQPSLPDKTAFLL